MSHSVAPRPTLYALSVPSCTAVRTTDIHTPPALGVATLRLLLAVALPHRPAAPTAAGATLPSSKNALVAQLLPLSGVPPLPQKLCVHRQLGARWTRPPMRLTRRPSVSHLFTPVGFQSGNTTCQQANSDSSPTEACTQYWCCSSR